MKLRHTNQIELSVANLRALLADVERREREGRPVTTLIYRTVTHPATGERVTVAVSVVSDEEHYSPEELADRTSPYLPPEAWAGVR